jgi:hypothetical protein
VRAHYSLGSVRSRRRRQAAENRVLEEHGERAIVYELQGDLRFATSERVLREIVEADAPCCTRCSTSSASRMPTRRRRCRGHTATTLRGARRALRLNCALAADL